MPRTRTVWLVSPYDTGSHRSWTRGYATHSRHAVQPLTMAGRFWKWRMQGGAIELAAAARTRLTAGEVPDAIIGVLAQGKVASGVVITRNCCRSMSRQ